MRPNIETPFVTPGRFTNVASLPARRLVKEVQHRNLSIRHIVLVLGQNGAPALLQFFDDGGRHVSDEELAADVVELVQTLVTAASNAEADPPSRIAFDVPRRPLRNHGPTGPGGAA